MTDQPLPSATGTAAADDESWMTPRKGREGLKPERVAFWFAIGFPVVLAIAGAFVIIAVFNSDRASKPATAQTPAPAALAAPTDSKDQEIAQLRAELSAMQSRNIGYAPATAAPAQVYADPSALAQLSVRLDRIEANQKHLALAAASASAAAALEAAAKRSTPFERELLIVERTLEDPRKLDPIRPLADKGVPSETLLAVQFPKAATAASIAARGQAERKDLVSALARLFSGIISVRTVKDDGSQSPDALLARAQTRIESGDLEGAVTIVSTLPPQARAALKPWLDDASNRLLITQTTRTVTESALRSLAEGQAPVATPVSGGAR